MQFCVINWTFLFGWDLTLYRGQTACSKPLQKGRWIFLASSGKSRTCERGIKLVKFEKEMRNWKKKKFSKCLHGEAGMLTILTICLEIVSGNIFLYKRTRHTSQSSSSRSNIQLRIKVRWATGKKKKEKRTRKKWRKLKRIIKGANSINENDRIDLIDFQAKGKMKVKQVLFQLWGLFLHLCKLANKILVKWK